MRRITTILMTIATAAAAPAFAQAGNPTPPATAGSVPMIAVPTVAPTPADDALSCATTFFIGTAIRPTPEYVKSMDDRVAFMLGLYASQHPEATPTSQGKAIAAELVTQRTLAEADGNSPAASYAWCNSWIQVMGQTVVATGGSIADESAARKIAKDVKPDRAIKPTDGQVQVMAAAYAAWRQAGYPIPDNFPIPKTK